MKLVKIMNLNNWINWVFRECIYDIFHLYISNLIINNKTNTGNIIIIVFLTKVPTKSSFLMLSCSIKESL